MNTKAKNDFKKIFFKLMSNSDFSKTMDRVRKHRDKKRTRSFKGLMTTYAQKPKIPNLSPSASYMEKWALFNNHPANV